MEPHKNNNQKMQQICIDLKNEEYLIKTISAAGLRAVKIQYKCSAEWKF